ncbi:MAG: TetR/AcrR family transcriptional regulator [Caldisericia bacterium]|nr:TetR/AcrR family transcriptional regulator [Caldisericia bacterium]
MNIKKLKGEGTKKKIIEVATYLFNDNGYDKTSVQDICEKAGVSKGAFFHHFPTKEFLFLEILNEFLEKLEKRMIDIEKKSDNIPQAMIQMTKILEEIFIISEGKLTIFLEFMKQSEKNEEIMKNLSIQFKKYENYVENLIEKGKREGSIRDDINSKFFSSLIVSLSIGMIFRKSLFKNDKLDSLNSSKKLLDFILNSIKRRI